MPVPVKSCGYAINSRKLLRPGHGWTTPTEGAVCRVVIHDVSGDGSSPAARSHCATGDLQITIGAADNEFSAAIERCLETMKPGEMCEIRITLDTPEEPRHADHLSHRGVPKNKDNGKPLAQSGQSKKEDHTLSCNTRARDSGAENTNCFGEDVKTDVIVVPETDLDTHCGATQTPKMPKDASRKPVDVCGTTQPETTATISVQGEHRGSVDTDTGSGDRSDSRDCVLRISLLDITQATVVWRLSAQEKLTRAQQYKAVGAQLYRQGSTEWAFRKFSRALKYVLLVVDDDGLSAEERALGRQLRCQCYMNLAACQLKHANSTGIVANCTKGLALESNNVKGLFRRAQAYIMQHEHDAACDDLQAALAIDPNNGAVERLLRKVKVTVQRENAPMAAAFAKLASSGF